MLSFRKLFSRTLQPLTLIGLFTLLSGCAAMNAAWEQQTCTPTAAYNSGVNDAQGNQPMQTNYAANSTCPQSTFSINKNYEEGYMHMKNMLLKSKKKVVNKNYYDDDDDDD